MRAIAYQEAGPIDRPPSLQDIELPSPVLSEVAQGVDAGRLHTTLTERLAPISAANLKSAHTKLESGAMRGKLVLEGWA